MKIAERFLHALADLANVPPVMRQRLLFLIALLLGGACGKGDLDLPLPDVKKLLPGGNVLAETGLARLELDPLVRDPLTGLGACSDLLTYCFEPGQKDLDTCASEVRRCGTSEPWQEEPCCPEACVKAYQRERKNADPLAALDLALFSQESCYPGVTELVR